MMTRAKAVYETPVPEKSPRTADTMLAEQEDWLCMHEYIDKYIEIVHITNTCYFTSISW